MSSITLFESEKVALTTQEKETLNQCEAVIRQGLKTFYEVGMALATIRDQKLYRATHANFEAYCQEYWEIGDRRARQLISAAKVTDNVKSGTMVPVVSNNSQALPETERQVRPLTILKKADDQREVWAEAVKTAPDGHVTGEHVEATVKRFQEEKKHHAPPESDKAGNVKPTFNATTDSIEWAKWTWNPVTGCQHGCPYCYARDIAMRFTGHFNPEFHEDRLNAPFHTNIPASRKDETGIYNVFVCSMADLFGEWVPVEWIQQVIDVVSRAPQWNFLFLTKNPERYCEFTFPQNCWLGATADTQEHLENAMNAFYEKAIGSLTFISCEPFLEPLTLKEHIVNHHDDYNTYTLDTLDWIILGGRSQTSQMPAMQPEWEWVENLLSEARQVSIPVYFKPNLTVRPREYPSKLCKQLNER